MWSSIHWQNGYGASVFAESNFLTRGEALCVKIRQASGIFYLLAVGGGRNVFCKNTVLTVGVCEFAPRGGWRICSKWKTGGDEEGPRFQTLGVSMRPRPGPAGRHMSTKPTGRDRCKSVITVEHYVVQLKSLRVFAQ